MLEYHLDHNVCQKKKLKIPLKQPVIQPQMTLQRENEALKLTVAELRGENKILKEHPQIINNNTFNQANHITIIGEFNEEKIEDILTKVPNLLEDTINQHLTESVPILTKEVHCNPTVFPEYSNVYITKYNSPFAMVFSNGRFQRKLKKHTLDNVIEKFISMLGTYIDDNEFSQKIFDRYELYRDSIEKGGEKRAELEDELIGILIDYGELYKMEQISKSTLKEFTLSQKHDLKPLPSHELTDLDTFTEPDHQ
jgi:hypothetical protein